MKSVFLIFVLLGISYISSADIITTTDGGSYEGEIINVTINTEEEGAITFDGEEISNIRIGRERHHEEEEVDEQREEAVPQEPEEEVEKEEPPKEPEAVEKERKEEPVEEEKPNIITPQIKGLDEGEYKTY